MLLTPTKAEMKHRSAIASDPIIIQEFIKRPDIVYQRCRGEFENPWQTQKTAEPHFRHRETLLSKKTKAAVLLENLTASLDQNLTETKKNWCSPSLKFVRRRRLERA